MPGFAGFFGGSWLFFVSFVSVSQRQIIRKFGKLLQPLSSQVSSQLGWLTTKKVYYLGKYSFPPNEIETLGISNTFGFVCNIFLITEKSGLLANTHLLLL